MTAAGPTRERARRGRILLVDCAELSARITGEVDATIEATHDLFEALGRLGTATVRDPIQAVVVSAREVKRRPAAAAESVRRLDPSVQLVLIDVNEDDALGADAIRAGFDQAVIGDGADRLLADVLRDPDRRTGVLRADPPVIETHATRRDERPPMSKPSPTDQPKKDTPPVSPRTPAPALGDVDLVAAVLDDPTRLPALALELLRQESGLTDAHHHRTEPGSTGHTRVELRDGERAFGWLTATTTIETLAPWARWLARWCRLAEDHASLREKAFCDPLTGAFNRRYVDEHLPRLLDEARERRRAVAVMVFDIDDLKQYNDRFGHDAGDEVLCETVKLLKAVVRAGDCVCRIGGDEFVVIFADPEGPRTRGATAIETVEQIVHRFRDQVCKLRLPKLGPNAPGPVSVSAGLATYPWDAYDAASLLKRADHRAIESKRKGKNAVTLGPTEEECNGGPRTDG